MASKKVYQWTAAVRIEHWWHAASMFVLVLTGLYIHSPFMKGGTDTMAWMRFFHFVSMYILIFGLIWRVYIAVNSKTAPDIMELLPLPKNLKGIPDVLGYYFFLKPSHKNYGRYNPMQALTYFVMGLVILVMTATGFALYEGWLHPLFAWVNPVMGGKEYTRVVHYLCMWVLICLSLVHIYIVTRQNILERDRTLMSMVDGYRETLD